MGSKFSLLAVRLSWADICREEELLGRWVALDNVRYAPGSAQPAEADVVDADEDLAALCARMRAAERTSCAILFVEEDAVPAMSARRLSPVPPRAAQH